MFPQPNLNSFPDSNKKRYLGVVFFVVLAVVIIYGYGRVRSGTNAIEVANDNESTLWQKLGNLFYATPGEPKITIENDPEYTMPKEEEDRWDILILGIRGENDENAEEAGALLTDTMMILSHDKTIEKTSLVSIPRDLYVRIYGDKINKINSAYEIGILRKNGIGFIKKLISRITGIYIDNVIVLDFSSFKKIIDDLGGIDVELDKPFTEKQQWGYEFDLPVGINHLDGQTALYYARSRFSTNDFDRAQRQQKIIMATKDKILKLNLLSDPIKTLTTLNTIRNNIHTDLNIWDTGGLISLSKEFSGAGDQIKRYVITTENLVYESHVQTDAGNLYVLLPVGDNLQGIKQLFQDIFK